MNNDFRENKVDFAKKLEEKQNSIQTLTDRKMQELKQQILEDVQLLSRKAVESHTDAESQTGFSPVAQFVPKTLYGIFKSRFNGVPADQTTEVKETNSTIEIVTTSASSAQVHLVENLGKTQFANLNEAAVDVLEGNPQAYEDITEVEPGAMVLEEDTWKITRKIKVKLS